MFILPFHQPENPAKMKVFTLWRWNNSTDISHHKSIVLTKDICFGTWFNYPRKVSTSSLREYENGQITVSSDTGIRDQVIERFSSSRLRRKLLEKGNGLSLNDLQTIARAMEAGDRHAGNIENGNGNSGLNAVRTETFDVNIEWQREFRTERCPYRNIRREKMFQIRPNRKLTKGQEMSFQEQRVFEVPQGRPFCRVL